jgi:gliding motility-associated-like protein
MKKHLRQLIAIFTIIQLAAPLSNAFCQGVLHQKDSIKNKNLKNGKQVHGLLKSTELKFAESSNLLPEISGKLSATSCITSTFYAHIPAPLGRKINIKEIQSLPDGNFIVAGNLTGNGKEEGFLYVLSNNGTVIAQRLFYVGNFITSISNVKIFKDGSIAISGKVDEQIQKPFVAVLNSDLSNKWMHIFNTETDPANTALNITKSENICYAFKFGSKIHSILLTKNGDIIWLRQFSFTGLASIGGFSESSEGTLVLAANCQRSAKNISEVSTIDELTGAVLTSNVMASGTEEIRYDEINSFNNNAILTGIVKRTDGQYRLVRENIKTSEITYYGQYYTLPKNIDFKSSFATDNSGDAIGVLMPSENRLLFLKHFNGMSRPVEHVREYHVEDGATLAGIARSFVDDGFLFGVSTKSEEEIILIKTDSVGNLASCDVNVLSASYTERFIIPNLTSTPQHSKENLSTNNAVLNFSAANLKINFDCRQDFCPPTPAEDKCLSSYYKSFRSNSFSENFNRYFFVKDNRHMVTTTTTKSILGNTFTNTFGIKLLDEKGNFLKGAHMFLNGISVYADAWQIGNDRIAFVHQTIDNGKVFYTISLLTSDMDIIWSKSFQTYNGYDYYYGKGGIGDFKSDKDGNFYFITYGVGFNESAKIHILKLSPDGESLWFKAYETGDNSISSVIATTTHSSLILLTDGYSNTSASIQLDKLTGNLLGARKYKNPTGQLQDRDFIEFYNGKVYYAGNTENGELAFGSFDSTGKPLQLKSLGGGSTFVRQATFSKGTLFANFKYTGSGTYNTALIIVDTGLNIKTLKEFIGFPDDYPVGMKVSENGYIYEAGNLFGNSDYSANPYLKKYEPDGTLGTCNTALIVPTINDLDISSEPVTFTPLNRSFTSANISLSVNPNYDVLTTAQIFCSSDVKCTFIKLEGPETVCDTSKDYFYSTIKDVECKLTTKLNYDTSFIHVVHSADSGYAIRFKKSGKTWINVELITGCQIYKDSIQVSINAVSNYFSLGPDQMICPDKSLTLNAGPRYSSYIWQDNSTDSTLMVTRPGTYFVTVTNFCKEVLKDTVQISPALIPPLYIGNDTAICSSETVNLNAGEGFSSYTWISGSSILGRSQQISVKVLSTDINVVVAAQSVDGCIVNDTINLKSLSAGTIFLGNDTSFCTGQTIKLTAGNNFISYLWNTGSTDSVISVAGAGIYIVRAQNINGCYATDTLLVNQIYSLPSLFLGEDFSICDGSPKTLVPGNFNKYLWQDGSTGSTFIADKTGLYWVTVIDNNNCSATDSVEFKSIFPIPADFLRPVDSLCRYAALTLVPLKTFSSYNWSTGSLQPEIITNRTGIYTLTATDQNGCIGSDTTFVVQKECATGVYIPNAFTPNNDGKNDRFRVLIYGETEAFLLRIYDRWGELIFSTNDPVKSWDGNIKGIAAPSGVYVWQTSYRLKGSTNVYKKGSVALIR